MTAGIILKTLSHAMMILFAGYMVHKTKEQPQRKLAINIFCAIILIYSIGAFLD